MTNSQETILRPDRFSDEDHFLVSEYLHVKHPLDDLAYTEEFEGLARRFATKFGKSDNIDTRRDVLRRLFNLRKNGQLPRLGRPQQSKEPDQFLF